MSNPPSAAGSAIPGLLALQEALKESYILHEQIGAGAMGTVFKAHDVKRDRAVAIKVLRGDLARSMGAERFRREILTAARLMHPHIISVFDDGDAASTLYFVMPYVAGESLRERLNREGVLPVDEAVRIATQLAGALRYAHAAGVVHRDIKPENILLADGHAWLADFGIARAAIDSGDGHHTTTGAIVGSPDYVSPEQLRGQEVDGRADIYSLGCVLYEMLAGRAPFVGKSLEAVLLGHMTQPAPSLQLESDHLQRVLATALAKLPDDRFSSAEEFECALAGEPVRRRWSGNARRRALMVCALVAAGVAGVSVFTAADFSNLIPSFSRKSVALDTTRYLVLPMPGNASGNVEVERALQDALAKWREVDVVDRATLVEDLRASSSRRAITRAARQADIGRIIRANATRMQDSLRISLELADGADPRRTLGRSSVTMASLASPQFGSLVESLLLRGVAASCRAHSPGTSSLRAIHACDHAFSALNNGNLVAADSHFVSALRGDDRYARAALWLAQIRSWVVPHPRDVAPQIQIALADSSSLDPRERGLLRGFEALESGDYGNACESFSRMLNLDTLDFAAWLGVGECHRRDRVVVRDARSPSGWSFQSNYNEAIRAYRRAFELHPTLLAAYRDRSFYDVRTILLTEASKWLVGNSRTGAAFAAFPTLLADTLALVPYPMAWAEAARNSFEGLTAGIDRQRDMLHELSTRWSESYPASSAAAEASAVAAELAGDVRALDEIARARRLAPDESERQRLAAGEVWLRLKFGLGGDERHLRAARALADSLVALPPERPVLAHEFAALANLLGKPSLAARFARAAAPQIAADYSVPTGVAEPAAALEVFAALGTPSDSIEKLERELELAIRNGISHDKQKTIAADLLTRPTMVAFPSHKLAALTNIASAGAYIDAERAFARADYAQTRAALRRIAVAQRSYRPSDLTADGLFVVAWLHNAVGESDVAAAKLDGWLAAARWFPPRRLNDAVNAGSLLRAMLLRAQIAMTAGDRARADQWYRRIRILWIGAEPDVLKLFEDPAKTR